MRVPFLARGRESRYERQETIIGKAGQKRLSKSRAVIIGLGALGSVSSLILARSGVGNLTLIDGDVVEFVNLHRQFLYIEESVGRAKALMAKERLEKVNTEIKINHHVTDVTYQNIDSLLKRKDIVLDCSDNIQTRLLINDYCRKKKLPWISASAVRDIGRVISFTHERASPCFRCLYDKKINEMSCENSGVYNTLTTIVASLQAHEVLRRLLGKKPEKQMLSINLKSYSFEKVEFKTKESCPVCAQKKYDYLAGKGFERIRKRGQSFQFMGKSISLTNLKRKFEHQGKVEDFGTHIRFNTLTIFADGRVLVNAQSLEEAKALYNRFMR